MKKIAYIIIIIFSQSCSIIIPLKDLPKPDGQYRKDVDSSKLISVMKEFKFTSLGDGIKRVYDNFSQRYN